MTRLPDLAKHLVTPDGAVSTAWPRVRDTCNNLGWKFDDWQDDLGRLILAKDRNGMFASSLVALSLCRQVGKTYLVGCIAFALCLTQPGTTVIWTAHRGRTATETFRSMKAKAKSSELAAFIDQRPKGGGIRSSNGEQEIEFLNESRILFGARESGFGVGFANVGLQVLDEVQRATVKAMDDLLPTTNAAANPLVLCMGTPPRPTDDGEVFSMLRREAISGESNDVLYVELGASDRFDLSDDKEFWRQLRRVNPSFPHRVGERAILRNRKGLTDDSVFREVFGLWDEDVAAKAILPRALWDALEPRPGDPGETRALPALDAPPSALGVHMSLQRSVVISGVWDMGERWHGEVLSLAQLDTTTAVEWLRARAGRRIPVVVDGFAAAGAMIPALKNAGLRVIVTNAVDMGKACGNWFDMANEGRFTHSGQAPLSEAVRFASRRVVGKQGAWAFAESDPDHDVSPLVSVVLALFGANVTRKKSGSGRSNGNRVGVVL
jgi:hypothetical protein